MTSTTVFGRNVWNPVWLAPEIMLKKEYTEMADVYSFGIIMWETLTCANPFDEFKATYETDRHLEDAIIHTHIRPSWPKPQNEHEKHYMDLAARCWAHEPGTRPSLRHIIIEIEGLQEAMAPATLESYRRLEKEQLPTKDDSDSLGGELPSALIGKSDEGFNNESTGVIQDRDTIPTRHSAHICCMLLVVNKESGQEPDARAWTGYEDGTIMTWDLKTKQRVEEARRAHKACVSSMTLTDTAVWSSSATDPCVMVWDRKRLKLVKKIKVTVPIVSLFYMAPYHVWGLSLWPTVVHLFDVKTYKLYKGVPMEVEDASTTRKGIGRESGEDEGVKQGAIILVGPHMWVVGPRGISICSLKDASVLERINVNGVQTITRVREEVWGSVENNLFIWNHQGEKVHSLEKIHNKNLTALLFDDKHRVVYSASLDHSLAIWNPKTYQEVARKEHQAKITAVLVTEAATWTATADGNLTVEHHLLVPAVASPASCALLSNHAATAAATATVSL
eukprot:TRINITY_DN4356_c0_g2_i1.p1 TRINITY_DN4356_c0_g2~~TRINITY_DN4356_c0_g2_i1.p1  ORF type:complete len:505 (-),score=62.03 TRINITY_DN4356_c0_g2_i1:118-1632(-)